MNLTEIAADALKGNRTLRCTDAAYDQLLGMYGTDRAVFTAVAAINNMANEVNAESHLRYLCRAHKINPDA